MCEHAKRSDKDAKEARKAHETGEKGVSEGRKERKKGGLKEGESATGSFSASY